MHKLSDEKDQKLLELESKERIALEQITSNITIEAMRQETKASHIMLAEEMKHITSRLQLLDQVNIQQNQNVSTPNSQIDNGNNNATLNSVNPAGA